MEDTENVKSFSDWMADLIFFFAHLQSINQEEKIQRNNECKTNRYSSIFGKHFNLADCHLNKHF